jgi:hypothetical protein
MKLHWLFATVLVGMVTLLPTQSDAYIGILYFRNLETGERNKVVTVHPGDRIQVGLDFFTNTGEKWKELSIFLDEVGSSIITDATAADILNDVDVFFSGPVAYQSFTYGPATVYNSRKNPGDITKSKITDRGIYLRVTVDQANVYAQTGISNLFDFTVPLTATPGESLHWGRTNMPFPNDVSTRLLDAAGGRTYLQFNSLLVVPEPAAIAGLAIALAGFARLRRRQ